MEILIKAIQLILSLSILVFLHELGHFIPSKLFKTRVDKFYIFFDPWFSLFKFKRKETEYGIGWLPLGGYCKISGMIDESMDKEQMKLPPQPWEFRSKPAWQRLIIMLGGIIMNVLLAILIYIVLLYSWGETYLPNAEVKYGITVDSLAMDMGLRNGDKIISIDNKYIEDFGEIRSEVLLGKDHAIQIIRDGQPKEIDITNDFIRKVIKLRSADFISIRVPVKVGALPKKSPAKDAGIKVDDRIIGVNNTPVEFFDEFRHEIVKYKKEKIALTVIRGADTLTLNMQVSVDGTIGIYPYGADHFFTLKNRQYSLLGAIPAGTVKAFKSLGNYIRQFKLIFSRETGAYESVGGFITIGNIFPAQWDWFSFWQLTAFLSIILAFMNILPIPALDGGHVIFILYEIITGRKPSDKFLEYAQITGMIFLLALLLFANGNDILRLFK